MKIAAVVALVAVLAAGWFAHHRHDAGATGTADPERVRACVQATGRSATIQTSSTGQRQVAVAHGPVRISDNVTLENATTYVSFMSSANEAAWWAEQLRQSPDIPDDSIVSSGNEFVQYSAGASAADRAAIASCLG